MKTVKEKIEGLRELMREHHLDAYIVPGTDPHASEYMADHWKETTWLSGFKGESGTVVVTLKEAYLWTDSRYYLQADKELSGSGIGLMKESELDTPSITDWLKQEVAKQDIKVVGINPEMFTIIAFNSLKLELQQANISISSIDLINPLWTDNRPAIPQNKIYEYKAEYAGETTADKLKRIREQISAAGAQIQVVSALDEIAWLLNIRGTDVAFNPVVISYVVLEQDKCTLFIDKEKIDNDAAEYLRKNDIDTADYNDVYQYLGSLSNSIKVLLDGNRVNEALAEALPKGCKIIDKQSPILFLKSKKNSVELEGERIAMRKDAVALTKFFYWLEKEAFEQKEKYTEYELMDKLHSYRAEQQNFVMESFGTIAGYEGNGAIVHYEATPTDCADVYNTGVLLLDSGGQYLDGTTDITRTVWLGDIPGKDEEKYKEFKKAQHDYTLVLKGHIALGRAKFIRGTRGNQLDVLAHQYMWQEGITYGHGTGHGVGHFLGCHEGPQNIRTDNNPAQLHIGNICSDEPGIYRANEYGIRIENLVAVEMAEKTEFGEFYQFEILTLCPYDKTLIDLSMLTAEEKQWINAYHQKVLQIVSPFLSDNHKHWLQQKCSAL
ncbi:MAG: aminopeptidase P family N-terminal domain-containing protein [Paludibacteraceae bacterium]|nr:aminopeptidase P family N-terminal domain-containing protein [Paludibacteraceae bacterium]